MSYATFSPPRYLPDDATFRTWVQAIEGAIVGRGWVVTSDTGQIDPTTVTKPGAANTAAGVRIYRMADALQATKPVFLRVEYGSGGAATSGRLRVRVGTATSGASVLTGNVSPEATMASTSTPTVASTPVNAYVSGDTNWLALAIDMGAGDSTTDWRFLHVERTRDASGAVDGTGIYIFAYASGSAFVPFAGSPHTAYQIPRALFPDGNATSGAVGGDVQAYPHFPGTAGLLPPVIGILVYVQSDLAAMSPVNLVDPYGDTRPYLPLGTNRFTSSPGQIVSGGNGNTSIAMRWE